jgi:predicted adenylyl cyclase CyaB
MQEIEAKYRLDGPDEHARLRQRLAALGAQQGTRVTECNLLFDRADGALSTTDRVLRLRTYAGQPHARLTFKGPATRAGGLKRREEHEVTVEDAATMRAILEGLGYAAALAYGKERETWLLDGAEVALDELAFGWFCEIEGTISQVQRVAGALGLGAEAAEPAGYPALMARFLARTGQSPSSIG